MSSYNPDPYRWDPKGREQMADTKRWEAKAKHSKVQDLNKKISTTDALIKKVGPNSPRYKEFLASKARWQAGKDKVTAVQSKPSAGMHTKNTRTSNTAKPGTSGQKPSLKRASEKGTRNPDSPYKVNNYRPEQVRAMEREKAGELSQRKRDLSSPENRAYYKMRALKMKQEGKK
jgi:hypothetical protein